MNFLQHIYRMLDGVMRVYAGEGRKLWSILIIETYGQIYVPMLLLLHM